ncbi:MAG TPA: invasion associated locus B family protein [Rhizomicrobium sp.]|nr:invasion associated locus B family protein [Rhizomicrobium sp.]
MTKPAIAMTRTALAISGLGILLAGAALAIGSEHLFFRRHDPRDDMETIAKLQDWQMTCQPRTMKKGGCILQSGILQKGTNNMVAELTIAKKDDADVLSIVVPLGVYIPAGIQLTVGHGSAKTIPFKTCLEVGCIANVSFDSGLAGTMSQNSDGVITVVAGNGKSLSLNFSLRGYNDAISARAVDKAART